MNVQPDTFYDAETKIWSGPRTKEIYGPDTTMGEVALLVYSRLPADKVVQIMDSTGEELTAGELVRNSKVVAWNLQRLGLQIGDVVGICANNTTHLTAVLIGALLCGTPTNALFPEFDKDTIKLIYKGTTPKIVFCDVGNYTTVKQAIDELKSDAHIFTVNGELQGVRSVKELLIYDGNDLENESYVHTKFVIPSFPCAKLTGDDTAMILCSSGTTGPPKVVMCSHNYLIRRPLVRYLPSDSVVFSFSTMYWASAVMILQLSNLYGVKRVITDKPFTPEYFVELVEKHRITETVLASRHVVKIVQTFGVDIRKRLDSIRTLFVGGSKLPPMASEGMNAILGNKRRAALSVGYGMSEISGVAINSAGPGKRREDTAGKLIANTEVCIVDENGKRLGVNEQGILHVRVPFKLHGYYRNPEATRKAFVDGWYNSEDLAYFDQDVLSRASDVFKSNGFQIYPASVEECVLQLPGVLETCVLGIPDLTTDNLIACAIVRANNEQGRRLAAADVELCIQQNLAKFYHLTGGVHFVDALPKTPSDKILRRKVLETVQKAANCDKGKK